MSIKEEDRRELQKGKIKLEVFADEIHHVEWKKDNSKWMYIGLLFVPLEKKRELLNKLLNKRCIQYDSWNWGKENCENRCGYHKYNNTEIHYRKIGHHNAKFRIGRRWIKEALIEEDDKGGEDLIYFYILGINLTNLDLERFGSKKERDLAIYNRFFRTVLRGGKFFFPGYEEIHIKNIFHDKGSQRSHKYFPWYSGYKVDSEDERMSIKNKIVKFIDSDHRNCVTRKDKENSQFIQLIDLILGGAYNCIHDPAKREEKNKIGLLMRPLVKRLLKHPKRANSSYNYYRKQQISFFPKEKMERKEALSQLDLYRNERNGKETDLFYTDREILFKHPDQTALWEFN